MASNDDLEFLRNTRNKMRRIFSSSDYILLLFLLYLLIVTFHGKELIRINDISASLTGESRSLAKYGLHHNCVTEVPRRWFQNIPA